MGFGTAITRPADLGYPAVGIGASTVLLDVRIRIDLPRRTEPIEAAHQVLVRLKPSLTQAGIGIPFPTMQVLLHRRTEAADGDRARQREDCPAPRVGRDPSPRENGAAAGRVP